VLLASAIIAVGYDASKARAFFESVDAALEILPGVASAAGAAFVPFGSGNSTSYVTAEGGPAPSSATGVLAENNFVSADYFDVVGTPLERGRTFNTADTKETPQVAVVNHALAARLWPNDDPVGKRFSTSNNTASFFTVVGVARMPATVSARSAGVRRAFSCRSIRSIRWRAHAAAQSCSETLTRRSKRRSAASTRPFRYSTSYAGPSDWRQLRGLAPQKAPRW
jgi:hypothetical protein